MTSIAYRVYDGDECVADADADASYAYDGLGRLVSEAAAQSGTNALTQFSYDLAGNRISVSSASSVVSSTFTHNRMDGILHDAAGNVTNYARNGVSYDLAWNTQGQLLSVSTNGVLAESYTWDPFGRRSSTTEHTEHTETTTFHVYDGDECVADLDASGNPLRTYTWGQGIDNLLAVTVYTYQPNSPQPTASSYYAVKDHLGSVHALVDESGEIAAQFTYDAWGNVQSAVGNGQSAVLSRYLFQGREYSFATGLYNFRARWYDPATGRWLSKDPIGLEGGLNLYAFCGDDPVNMRDPWGYRGNGSKASRYGGHQKLGVLTTPATSVRTAGLSAFGSTVDGLNYLAEGTLSLGESITYALGLYPIELAKMKQYYSTEVGPCNKYIQRLRTRCWYEIQYVLLKIRQEGRSGKVMLVIDTQNDSVSEYTGPWISDPSSASLVIIHEWIR